MCDVEPLITARRIRFEFDQSAETNCSFNGESCAIVEVSHTSMLLTRQNKAPTQRLAGRVLPLTTDRFPFYYIVLVVNVVHEPVSFLVKT